MGNKSNVLTEIKLRLTTAMDSGGVLENLIKMVRIGSIEDSRNGGDLGFIIIQHNGGDEVAHYRNQHWSDDMEIQLLIVCSKLDAAGNSLFNESDGTGATILLEKVFNVIDKNTSGNIDLLLASTCVNFGNRTYSINETIDSIEITATCRYSSQTFLAGGR